MTASFAISKKNKKIRTIPATQLEKSIDFVARNIWLVLNKFYKDYCFPRRFFRSLLPWYHSCQLPKGLLHMLGRAKFTVFGAFFQPFARFR
jgi:hypothetical protein